MSRSAPPSARQRWGTEEEGCSVLHVDMDAFFASVELARRHQLRGRPVIVGGSGRSVVLAATYEARAFGVHSAMPMTAALRLCPHAVVVQPDHRSYQEVSTAVMGLLGEITPLVEQVSVDEAFLDVSGARRRLGPPTKIAELIREQVRARHGITCSVGIASTKFVAKLASGHAKPDGVLLIPRAATVDYLHSLPVEALWGVGEATRAQLARVGIRSVVELAHADPSLLQRALGVSAGKHLLDLSWGRDPRPVQPGREHKSIGAETTFAEDQPGAAAVQSQVLALADRCAARLRHEGLLARTVSVKVRTADFRTLSRSRTLPTPTDVSREIYLVARELVAGVDLGGLAIRLVGVRAEGLEPVAAVAQQVTLDEAVDGAVGQRRTAEVAMDRVRKRFGSGAMRAGTLLPAAPAGSATTARADRDLS